MGGKPFKAMEHKEALNSEGLIKTPSQLEKAEDPNFKPEGKAKKVGAVWTYPHFL